MTATAATLVTGGSAARPPSERISSFTVSIFRIFIGLLQRARGLPDPTSEPSAGPRPLSVTAAGGAVALDDGSRARGRRRVAAPPDARLAVDQRHRYAAQIADLERLERGAADR